MSNHIAKSVNCEPEMRSSATRTIVGVVIALPFRRRIASIAPSSRPSEGHQDAERVEEDERVEVADHVLLPQAPEEALHEQPGDPRHDRAQLDPRLLADVVDRARREVAHAGVPDVQVHEHVVREAVARRRRARGRAGRASRARSPCSRSASRRRASSRTRSSSAARGSRCRGSACAGSASTPRPRRGGSPSRSRPRRARPARRASAGRPGPSGCRRPSRRRRRAPPRAPRW